MLVVGAGSISICVALHW